MHQWEVEQGLASPLFKHAKTIVVRATSVWLLFDAEDEACMFSNQPHFCLCGGCTTMGDQDSEPSIYGCPPFNQPTNRPTNQPINQPINHIVLGSSAHFHLPMRTCPAAQHCLFCYAAPPLLAGQPFGWFPLTTHKCKTSICTNVSSTCRVRYDSSDEVRKPFHSN